MPLDAVALQPQVLNPEERIRLNQLELTIGKTVHSFLICAQCLIEIREKRLWREKYQSFGDYARRRWGICRSLADQVHPSRERPFVQAAQRLSTYTGFDATIVVAHVEQVSSAWSVHTACAKLIERCQQVQEQLEARFPELADANS